MPSTLVHLALAGLFAAALLGRAFRPRTLAVVLGAVVVVDLDVFLGLRALGPLQVVGAHRAAFHTLLLPVALVAALLYDTRYRERSWLGERFGGDGPHVAWVTVGAVAFAAIGPDLVTNGVNVLYPVHDQFYAFDGRMRLSDQRGVVQTFVNLSTESGGSGGGGGGGPNLDIDLDRNARGSSQETQYRTGVNPDPGGEASEPDPERVFLIVNSGLELLLLATGTVVTAAKLRLTRER